MCQPLRGLLSTKNDYLWLIEHSNAFERIEKELYSFLILTQFYPKLHIKLQMDASKLNRLGFALLQQHGEQWKLIQCGSKFLTPTEAKYATIELEMLAILWSIKKCRLYLVVSIIIHCCWSGRLLLVAAGGRSRRWTTECWRYSQHNGDSTVPIGETSTNTSCRRPNGKQVYILRRLF